MVEKPHRRETGCARLRVHFVCDLARFAHFSLALYDGKRVPGAGISIYIFYDGKRVTVAGCYSFAHYFIAKGP